jgi:hypothetical protein
MPISPDCTRLIGDSSVNPKFQTVGDGAFSERLLVSVMAPFLIIGYYTAVSVLKIAGRSSEGHYLRDSALQPKDEIRESVSFSNCSNREH